MKKLVAIFAHPDDESFGIGSTLARYSHEGVSTWYLCGTHGESGTVDPEYMQGYTDVAELRAHELECASHELGLAGVQYLNYRDSGMLGSDDNRHPSSLFAAATDDVARRIIAHIEKLQPDTIITHDQFGGYGHPDHIKLHLATIRAYEMMYGLKFGKNEQGITAVIGEPPASADKVIPRLYVTAFSRRFLTIAVRLLPLFGQNPREFGRNKDIDLVEMTSWFVPITTRIYTKEYVSYKEKASACHNSQRPPTQQGNIITKLAFRRSQNAETFSRVYPAVKKGQPIETDLFG